MASKIEPAGSSAMTPERIAALSARVAAGSADWSLPDWLADLGTSVPDLLAHIRWQAAELAIAEKHIERVTRERDEAEHQRDKFRAALKRSNETIARRTQQRDQVRADAAWLGGQVAMVRGLAEGVIRMSEPGLEDQASVRAGEIVRIFAMQPDGNSPVESPAHEAGR